MANKIPERPGVRHVDERLRLHRQVGAAAFELYERGVDPVERGAGHEPDDRSGRLAVEVEEGVHVCRKAWGERAWEKGSGGVRVRRCGSMEGWRCRDA